MPGKNKKGKEKMAEAAAGGQAGGDLLGQNNLFDMKDENKLSKEEKIK